MEITNTETIVGQEQNFDSQKSESMGANFANEREEATNDGQKFLVSALKSLRSTDSFDKNEHMNENVEIENGEEIGPRYKY